MPELVTIPISFFELAIDYVTPVFKLWIDRAEVIQAAFKALEPWGPRLDDVEAITIGKISEQGVTVKLPLKRVSFFFGVASCKFTQEAVGWDSADESITILDAALSALTQAGGVTLGARHAVIAVHLQPKTVPFSALLKQFMPPQLAQLDSTPWRTMASIAKWDHRKITIDGSGVLANAIFLRFERDFPATVGYSEMAERLRKDEEELFALLGVEEAAA
jgi:hypothetical protein